MSQSKKPAREAAIRRPWAGSAIWAVAIVGAMLAFAVVVNSFLPNRRIHWDWVTAMMVFGSAGLTWARHRGVV